MAGWYLERYAGGTNYTIQEIKSCLFSAKVPLPRNINLAVLQAVQRGLMMEVPSESGRRKAWALTHTGERYVEDMKLGRRD